MEQDFILLLREVAYHPISLLKKLTAKFETPSVLRVTKKEELRKYRVAPLFDEKYLVIFESLKAFQDNAAFIKFNIMFPVLLVETKSQFDDAVFYLDSNKFLFKVFHNDFTQADAINFVYASARQEVSESFCKAVVRQVGRSPLRILTAISVCDQMGYTAKVVERYVDKYVYVDRRKLIDTLCNVSRSKAARCASFLYLQTNRHWYRYIQDDLIDELNTILQIYKDKLEGILRKENLFLYLEEKHLTRAQVLYALSLFEQVSIADILALREFIKSATLLEVAMRIS